MQALRMKRLSGFLKNGEVDLSFCLIVDYFRMKILWSFWDPDKYSTVGESVLVVGLVPLQFSVSFLTRLMKYTHRNLEHMLLMTLS